MKYYPTIGMEIHCEMKTASKMFCGCKNDLSLDRESNTNICPVCTAQPGALPVPNQEAIRFVQKVGLAIGGRLREKSKFDRKNYFYPDLPKGYQISQYDEPLVEGGELEIDGKRIGITRIHMEEDTGKSWHKKSSGETLVDLNRSGVPLMELVTEPDITSGEEAGKFCRALRRILRYLEVSDADMEKGQMRCEANISLYREGEDRLSGTKVEVKNLNSFRAVDRAIAFEIKRQTDMLNRGEVIAQETRGWNEDLQETFSQRSKESAHDYRYFPEPDIVPMEFSVEYFERLRREIPELPEAKKRRFVNDFGISPDHADILVEEKALSAYFENIMSELDEKVVSKEFVGDISKARKTATNYLITEARKFFAGVDVSIEDMSITAENFAEFATMIVDGKLNSSAAQIVLVAMYETGGDPSTIMEERNLGQVSDRGVIEEGVKKVIAKNPKPVEDFRAGSEKVIGFLVGQVMKETQGKADPKLVAEILKQLLSE